MIVTCLPSIYLFCLFDSLLLRDFPCASMPSGISLTEIPQTSAYHITDIYGHALTPNNFYR